MTWHLTTACVAGTKRGGDEARNEDAFACLELGSMIAVIAADGAGSASHARIGARAAVEAARAFLVDYPTGTLVEAAAAARTALEDRARQDELELAELACTLLVVVADEREIRVAQIGDGLLVLAESDAIVSLSPPRDAYVNETRFVTDDDWQDALHGQSIPWSGKGAVLVLTDGVELLATQAGVPFPGFVLPLARAASRQDVGDMERSAALASFLRSERVCRHTDDDKTVVIAVRHARQD